MYAGVTTEQKEPIMAYVPPSSNRPGLKARTKALKAQHEAVRTAEQNARALAMIQAVATAAAK